MRIHYTGLAAIALLLGVCAFLSSDVARAGDGDASPAGAYVYDVRIVRVATPTPEGVEQPCPFLSGDATTISAKWPDVLAALKKRGQTTLLMDARVTGTVDRMAKVSQERQVPIVGLQSKTLTGENYTAMRLRAGCNADLLHDAGGLFYKVMFRGAITEVSTLATAPTETLNVWEGSHAALNGRTLVLSHREQQLDPGDKNARGVELYCFIHGRKATGR